MKRRLLPEAAYDFWCRDGRDGEESERVDTLASASVLLKRARASVRYKWQRSCWTIKWEVNERKVLRLLRPRRRRAKTPKEST